MTKGKQDKKAPNPAKEQKATEEDQLVELPEWLQKALKGFEEKLSAAQTKLTIGDYLKLLQIQRELEEELGAPKEIIVKWVEPKPVFSLEE